jgi:hypothetical protein
MAVFLTTAFFSAGDSTSSGIDPSRWQQHFQYLASDRLAGRAVGTPGADEAADYIASQLKGAGIEPLGTEGYFQRIPMRGAYPLPSSRMTLVNGADEVHLELGTDYLLYRTGAQTYISNPVAMVFAGYGIVAPEYDYNSYNDIDVAGKIVVLLTGEPSSTRSSYFEGNARTVYSDPEAKHRLAISRGARGTVLIPDPRDEIQANWERWQKEFAFEQVSLAYSPVGSFSILMNPQWAGRLMARARYSFREILEREEAGEMVSFDLPTRLSFHGEFEEREFIGRNVVGYLPGSQPELLDTAVLLSAHYDGLGVGPPVNGDSIYNGAFDNAAGIAALLEIARVLAAQPARPARSFLFLFTTGEENGLLGSFFYTEHPVFPLYRTIAAVNIDGVAAFDTFQDVIGVGSRLSSLGDVLEETARANGLTVTEIPSDRERAEAFNKSDQVAFADAGVPSILILDGLQNRHGGAGAALEWLRDWNTKIYHSPFDDLSQPVNLAAVTQHCNFLLSFCERLARIAKPPEWHENVAYAQARLQSIAERR